MASANRLQELLHRFELGDSLGQFACEELVQ